MESVECIRASDWPEPRESRTLWTCGAINGKPELGMVIVLICEELADSSECIGNSPIAPLASRADVLSTVQRNHRAADAMPACIAPERLATRPFRPTASNCENFHCPIRFLSGTLLPSAALCRGFSSRIRSDRGVSVVRRRHSAASSRPRFDLHQSQSRQAIHSAVGRTIGGTSVSKRI